ncbi:hypothetical protein [Salipiger sp. PrR003]|uniref:hypothetical protein n=1 Tax=Salipiger sp. PrR003 TaxID=2706776 RepID=UPI0013D9D881|nr:hypothetical protein [Salipiger sp. PrR003]NDV50586.1 hypothetical protein [Salipiger sp. PrR003]
MTEPMTEASEATTITVKGAVGVVTLPKSALELMDWRDVKARIVSEGETMTAPPNSAVLVKGDLLYDFGDDGGVIEGPVAAAVLTEHSGHDFHKRLANPIVDGWSVQIRDLWTKYHIVLCCAAVAGIAVYSASGSWMQAAIALACGAAVSRAMVSVQLPESAFPPEPSERRPVSGDEHVDVRVFREGRRLPANESYGADLLFATAALTPKSTEERKAK